MVDDHEELLSNSMARLERVRHKHERLSKILISVKAGVEHLQDKLKSTANEVSPLLPLQSIYHASRGERSVAPRSSPSAHALCARPLCPQQHIFLMESRYHSLSRKLLSSRRFLPTRGHLRCLLLQARFTTLLLPGRTIKCTVGLPQARKKGLFR